MTTPSLELNDVHVRRDDRSILGSVSVRIDHDQRWIVLGSNGCGKSTLLRIMALYDHPTSGTVDVLGERLGRTDIRVLRRRIGNSAAGLADQLRPAISILDVVMTAKFAALEPWWHRYDEADAAQARRCLQRLDVGHLAERTFGTLSSGEQKRVLLARTLMNMTAATLSECFDLPLAMERRPSGRFTAWARH